MSGDEVEMEEGFVAFSMRPAWISDVPISLAARELWTVLAGYANGQRTAFPSLARLRTHLGVSERSVIRYLTELEGAGLLRRTARWRPNGGRTATLYTLAWSSPFTVESVDESVDEPGDTETPPDTSVGGSLTLVSPAPLTPVSPHRTRQLLTRQSDHRVSRAIAHQQPVDKPEPVDSAMTWVYRHSGYTGTAFTVHLALAALADTAGSREVQVSIADLADRARTSRDATRGALRLLERDGLVDLVAEPPGGSRIYQLVVDDSLPFDPTADRASLVDATWSDGVVARPTAEPAPDAQEAPPNLLEG